VAGAFAVVLAATMALGFFADQRMGAINGHAAEIRDNWLPATRDLGNLAAITERYRIAEANHVLSTTPEEMTRAEGNIRAVMG
jgi:methyl-accepting chemotaxis protein